VNDLAEMNLIHDAPLTNNGTQPDDQQSIGVGMMAPHRDWTLHYLELMKEGTEDAKAETMRLKTSENEIPSVETDVYFRRV